MAERLVCSVTVPGEPVPKARARDAEIARLLEAADAAREGWTTDDMAEYWKQYDAWRWRRTSRSAS